jgi:VWFA-related protein
MLTLRKSDNMAAEASPARSILFPLMLLAILFAGSTPDLASPHSPPNFVSSVPPQQPYAAQPGEVRTVYVAVTEKDGTPIPNLEPEDFSVSENKESRQVVEVASAPQTPLILCLLVDSSGSERGNPSRGKNLGMVFRFLTKAITESDKAFIVSFNDDSSRVTGITNRLSELRTGIIKIANSEPRGSTALYDSLTESIKAMPSDQTVRKIVIVLGDFEDNVSRISLEKTVSYVRQSSASVFALVESDSSAHDRHNQKRGWEAAQRITKESGGLAFNFESSNDLETAFRKLQSVLRPTYIIRYRATENLKNGKSPPPKVDVPGRNALVLVTNVPTPAVPK